MNTTARIIRIAQRISRAKVALDLGLTNRDLFINAGCKDVKPHMRSIGLRRSRLSMLTYAMRSECAQAA